MDIPLVSPRKLDQYVARYPGVWIVDVRSGEEYRRSHIRYAVNIPYDLETAAGKRDCGVL